MKPPLQSLKNQSVVRKPTAFKSKRPKFLKSQFIPKVVEKYDLTKPLTSHSVPKTQESKVVKNDKVIALGMFRINHFKNSKVDNFVPNKHVKASIRTKPIAVSQPHVITKKDVNSNTSDLSFIRVENTAKTRRPQPRSNTKNDRVPSSSKSSCIKNNEVEVEEHHKNLLSLTYKKHMSSKCNNIKLVFWNDKYEFVCASCKKCLITANHDVCVFNYVNGMNSHGSKERLALPRPSKSRTCLRWLPTGRSFYLNRKLIESSDSECYHDLCMVCRLRLLQAYHRKFKAAHQLHLEVYFVEGLGHNLFSVGQFCDSDLEVAFRRNTCFVRNLEGVDMLKGN
ncbi:hypothetical protein Tco_0006353 [Tanacetum coccineum]